MMLAEPIAVAVSVARALDELSIPYVVGGSLASSTYGIPRATQDIDLVVRLSGSRVSALVSRLSSDFYIDHDMAMDAVIRRSCFNLLHLSTMIKIDLFVSDRSELSTAELERAGTILVGDPPYPLRVCSPEDIVIQKLLWYDKGGRISERQWRDLVGVLEVNARTIERDYIVRWARVLNVEELCVRAFAEAQTSE